MRQKAVISLFDLTGNAVRPWADAGYECFCFDIQHTYWYRAGNMHFIPMDILSTAMDIKLEQILSEYDVVFVSAFPPCTDLAVSGARWFEHKERTNPGTRKRAMDLVHRAREIAERIGAPYYLENPVSVISSEWRKPDYSFHPWEYAGWEPNDNYTKKTCLWTGGGFVMPPKKPLEGAGKPDNRIHMCAPGPERANIRSATPMGFARAVFETNKGK